MPNRRTAKPDRLPVQRQSAALAGRSGRRAPPRRRLLDLLLGDIATSGYVMTLLAIVALIIAVLALRNEVRVVVVPVPAPPPLNDDSAVGVDKPPRHGPPVIA